jgi:hypothetical protein
VPFAEGQHPVGDLCTGGKHESFGVGVGARTAQGRVEGSGELPGAVADQEPEVRGAVTKVHQEIADLLGGPLAVRVGGDPQDVHVAEADLHDEQAVQAPERYRAVHMEEVRGQHGRSTHPTSPRSIPGPGTRGRQEARHRPRCRSLPLSATEYRKVGAGSAAIALPQRARPDRRLGDQASDLLFLVAGAGFEPATSGL